MLLDNYTPYSRVMVYNFQKKLEVYFSKVIPHTLVRKLMIYQF